MDIKALQWELAAFVVDRGLDPLHTPKNLSMALAAEAGALLDLFKWAADGDAQGVHGPAAREAAADAIADSVLHAVHLADRLGIDLDEAIRRKLAKNAEKYPTLAEEAPAPAPAPAAAAPQSRIAVERRAVADRRITPDRRGAPEQRSELERRVGPDRRAGSERRSSAPRAPAVAEPEAQARVELPRVPAPPPPAAPEPPRIPAPPPPLADPPPARAARPEPPPPPPPEPEDDGPYAHLDTEATRRLVEVLSKQVNRARTDDPLARELHDELSTLKRALYAENPKRAWLAGTLRSIRRILDEATAHSVGAELRAAEYLAEVDRILDA
jgi:NTP pyrophosphatase (non-canonical NTP hydrolase)